MKYSARLVVAFALISAAFSLLVQAGSFNMASHGSTSGDNFSLDCGNEGVLIGARGRSGGWLDRLQGVCTRIATNGSWVGNVFTTGATGGSGGNAFSVTCPRDTAIKGMSGTYGWYVNKLNLRCRPLGASGSNSSIYVTGHDAGDHSFNNEYCSINKPARGFHGKSGGYIDRVGLICHTRPAPLTIGRDTPIRQLLLAPDEIVAVNLVTPQGPSTTAVTPFVQIQWTDRSTIEEGFRVGFVGPVGRELNLPAATSSGSRQAVVITDLPTGQYSAVVCARFNAADVNGAAGHNEVQCGPGGFGRLPFRIAAAATAATCSPVITSAERIGAGTGRVRWSHGCNNPTRFIVRLRCGDSAFGTVASTIDGTAREETFNFGVGNGALQVCASFPGQMETAFCSAQIAFQCN